MGTASIHEGVRRMRFSDLLERTEAKELTQEAASEVLGISVRTSQRWAERFEAEGDDGLVDRRMGRRGDIAGSAAVTVRRLADRPGPHPIIYQGMDRMGPDHPAFQSLADEQPPAPASPSALGKASPACGALFGHGQAKLENEQIENTVEWSGQVVGVRPWPRSPILSRCRSSRPMTALPRASPRNASSQLSGRKRRNATITGTSPRASVKDTSVWQFAVLPRADAYCDRPRFSDADLIRRRLSRTSGRPPSGRLPSAAAPVRPRCICRMRWRSGDAAGSRAED